MDRETVVISAATRIGWARRIRARSPSEMHLGYPGGPGIPRASGRSVQVEGDIPGGDDRQHMAADRAGRLQGHPLTELELASADPAPQ